MEDSPVPPLGFERFAGLRARYADRVKRVLELEDAGLLRRDADLGFIKRLADARAELARPANRRNSAAVRRALLRFDAELDTFDAALDRFERSLGPASASW